jgi:putative hydrolase of the HAD superfamily
MKLLIWDFDGTLGYREGGAWTASLFEVLQREAAESGVTYEQLRVQMQSGFPWLEPEEPHLHLSTAELWWAALEETFARAYREVGFEAVQAQTLAGKVRPTYLNPARWRRFDDVVPVLDALTADGWTHFVLSNHVPELTDILRAVGLTAHFARVFNSADLGYEKPHPRIFELALDEMHVGEIGRWAGSVWMVGDSYRADVRGAEAAGIPAILVRRHHPDALRFAESLAEVPAILG